MNNAPKMTMFSAEVMKRSLANNRVYWRNPTQSDLGRSVELVNERRTVQSMHPT
jgi:hypothetical protein